VKVKGDKLFLNGYVNRRMTFSEEDCELIAAIIVSVVEDCAA